ncbi:histidine kinase, partial [Aureobasidium melanogenum]
MNSLFNSALRQSNAIRKDLDAFAESATTSPALQGQLTTSLTSFSRTLDDYSRSAQQELVPEKAQKAQDRLTNFRAELLDYRSRFALLKAEHEEKLHQNNRNDLLGHRRPHGANATPENPYADSAIASSSRDAGANPLFRTRDGFVNTPTGAAGSNPYSSYQSPYALSTESGDQARENHALREQNFFASTNATLDEYLERGRAVLGDLGEQRDMLKNTQRKLYSVANTLGISGDTIRMVERRAKQDKWIFWTGVVVFVIFVYFVLKWLRPTANMPAPGHGEAVVDTLIDLISYDDRPTLLLDTNTRRIRFCNIAFDSLLRGTGVSTDLQSWVDSLFVVAAHATHEPIDLGTFAHQKWLGKSLGNSVMTVFCRWTSVPTAPGVNTVMLDHHRQIDKSKSPSEPQKLTDMYMGWLEPRDDPWMSYMNNYPFHETSLGFISSWHPQLRRAVQRMMVCPESRILYWGDEHTLMYNQAAVPILGKTAAITSALSDKLQIALLEAEMKQDSYARMARQAPIGMYSLRPDGYPVFVNDAYLELHGVSRAQFYKSADGDLGWNPTIYDEDLPLVENMWLSTINGTAPVQAQVRLKAPGKGLPNNVRWVESMSFAERDQEGNITSIQGWLLDVSPRKMNEQLISEKLQDALENKRATETFLDMLSHEMRNPLSSILQLADGIMSLLETSPAADTIESLKDSAQTITLCARHMKTIIDEVLTFSKLDSNLLVLNLERAQVPTIIETALKMFEKEIEHANIVANMEIINFFSNSIKFTKFERARRITVKLAASVTKPTEEDFGIAFLSPRKDITKSSSMPTTPATAEPDIKLGDEVYIYIGVEDTGRGLTEDECKVLFQRFAQASPKTYKTYGGSGLGLFISRGLAELQGGQIGVKSTAGVGSTFAFFIKTRRAEPPAPASRRGSVASTEALTDVHNLPHSHGKQDVKVLTMSSVAEESNLSVKGLHVLVCEDNKINQKVIAQQLRRLGVSTVHVADDGLAALNFLATTTFFPSTSSSPSAVPLSIILMDVEMPVMDGLGAVRRIRQLESRGDITTHVPVIAITANARPEQVAVALEAGMDEVVTKPFLVRELVPRMVALVQKYMKGG